MILNIDPTTGRGLMELWHVIELLALGVIGVLLWSAKNQVSRIDRLERDKADKQVLEAGIAEVKDRVESMTRHMESQHQEVTQRLDALLLNVISNNSRRESDR